MIKASIRIPEYDIDGRQMVLTVETQVNGFKLELGVDTGQKTNVANPDTAREVHRALHRISHAVAQTNFELHELEERIQRAKSKETK